MKKTFKLLGIFTIVAIIGFSMTACGDVGENRPSITILISQTEADFNVPNWNSTNTFAVNESIFFVYWAVNPALGNITQVVTTKEGGREIRVRESTRNSYNRAEFSAGFMYRFDRPGMYSVEVYFYDVNGNRSNTSSVSFEVR